jgi:phosphatidylinositol-3-phosphatase
VQGRVYRLLLVAAYIGATMATSASGRVRGGRSSGSSITYLQGASAENDAYLPDLQASFPANTTAGDLIVVAVSWDTSGGAQPRVSDSQGNSFSIATNGNNSVLQQGLAIFYAANIKGGADTVTLGVSVAASYLRLNIQEYSGVATTNPVDGTAQNIDTKGSSAVNGVTSGNGVTTLSGDLIFGAVMGDSGNNTTVTAGTGATQRVVADNGADNPLASEDLIQTSAGSVAATFTFSIAGSYQAHMVAFKTAAGGTPPPPAIPTINSATSASGQVGSAFSYQITATNSPTSFDATGLPSGLSINMATGLISGTPTAAGTSSIALSATNASGAGTASLTLTIAAESSSSGSSTSGSSITYVQGTSVWNDGYLSSLRASFPANTTAGDLIIVAVSWDTSGGAQPKVSDSQGNSYSVATNGNNTTLQQGLAIFYAPNIKGGADTVTLSPSVSASYLRLNILEYGGVAATNPVDGTAQNIDPKGTSAPNGVTSGNGVTTLSGDLIFGAVMGDSGNNTTITAGTGATQRVVADNGAVDPLASEDLIQTSAGSVAATFTFSMAGSYQAQMVAFKPAAANGTPPPPAVPAINSATSATGQVGSAFSYQITATNNPTSFNATGLPAGLSINTSTGRISGTPAAAGTSSITLSATNANGTGTATLSLTIASGTLPPPAIPVINSGTSATAQVDRAFSYQITATNNPTSFNATGLPAGLSINKTTGLISGTPTAAGTSSITLSATNASGTGTATLTLTITGAQSSQIQTVFLILMENQNWSGIIGNASAPYINRQLLPMASHAEQYYNPPGVHPSLPNYLWLEAGTNFGITDDNDPSSHSENTTQHLVTQLTLAGKTWKAYQEDIPGTNCPLTDVNDYAVHHDPFVYFTDVTNNNNSNSQTCIAHVRPYSELAADLQNNKVANYNFITPNMCDDMHDCGVSAGDSWLSTEIPKIMNSAAYRNGGAIFITWDEGENDSDGPIGMIVISPLAKGNGYSNSIRYTHSSTLLTLEETFGLSVRLGASASATDLSDLFK